MNQKINGSQLDYQIKLIHEWNVFKFLFIFIYFLGVESVNFMFFTTHLARHCDRPHYSFGCTIESKHFTREYSFNMNYASFYMKT